MAAVATETPARAMAVYAHPDDPDVACGGTLARWAADGCEVALVICAVGDKGTMDPAADPKALADARAGEVAAAAAALGVASHEVLGWPDGEVDNDRRLRERLVQCVRSWRPEVVLGPDPTAVFFGDGYVNHRDHRELGWALLDTVSTAAAMPLYFPSQGPPHRVAELYLSGTLEPDLFVDVGEHLAAKAAALRCHATQVGGEAPWIDELVRRRAEEAAAGLGVTHAEGFRRLVLT
jgi:LmbE family N-acetylglucosaminyl deacetylase